MSLPNLRINNPLIDVDPARDYRRLNGVHTTSSPKDGVPQMTVLTALVTPELAQKYLEGNVRNRKVSRHTVARYADDMSNGRWVLTHQGIAFSREGTLVDGQHRLLAIIESGVSVPMTIASGLDADAIMAIDQNRVRKSYEQLNIRGGLEGTITHHHTAVLRCMIFGLGAVTKGSNSGEFELMSRHYKAVQFAIDAMPTATRRLTPSSVKAALARAYYCGDHDRIREFASAITSGVSHADNAETIALLTRWLLRDDRTTGGEAGRIETYGRTCRALHAWLNGERLTRLYLPSQELFVLPA